MFTKWRFWGKNDPKPDPKDPPVEQQSLPDFVRGIQHAVNSGSQISEKNVAAFLDRYMDDDGTPDIQNVKIPRTGYVLPVPTITAAHPPNMQLEEMKVKMSVRMDRTVSKKAHPNSPVGMTRSSFHVSLAGTGNGGNGGNGGRQSNVIELEMTFKRGDPPEGVSRIIEELVASITPINGKGEEIPPAEPQGSEDLPPPPDVPFEGPEKGPAIDDQPPGESVDPPAEG